MVVSDHSLPLRTDAGLVRQCQSPAFDPPNTLTEHTLPLRVSRSRRQQIVMVLVKYRGMGGCSFKHSRRRTTMPTRSAQLDAFWQAFRQYAGLDHDHYVAGSFGDSPKMATELADLVVAGIKRATASLARDYGEGRESIPRPGDFVMMLDAEGQSDGRSSNLEAVADHGGLHFGQSGNRLRPGLRFRLVGLSTVMAAQSSQLPDGM